MNQQFGIGVYSVNEAARMIGMGGQTLRRWLSGYESVERDSHVWHEPLWTPQYLREDDLYLGFRDLVEARIVNALRAEHIGLPTIRKCIELARDIISDIRPFSTRHFKTDGKTIFLEITKGTNDPMLIDLRRRQHVFKAVVAPSLVGLEFGNEAAERWWLLPNRKTVVADPDRSFGRPILAGSGITTTRIAQAFVAEGSIARVAKLFEIKPQEVRDALDYEQSYLGTTRH
jgi:uncharacterized protein (DUF433 family)